MEDEILILKYKILDLHSDLDSMANKEKGANDLLDKYKDDDIIQFYQNKFNHYTTKYDIDIEFVTHTSDEELLKLKTDELNYRNILFGLNMLIKLMEAIKEAYYKELNQNLK